MVPTAWACDFPTTHRSQSDDRIPRPGPIAPPCLPALLALADTVYVSNERQHPVGDRQRQHEGAETVPVGKRPRGITLSKDGTQLYICASDDNTVQVMDLATLKVIHNLPSGEDPSSLPCRRTANG